MHIVIDLFGDDGDDNVITVSPEKTREELEREEQMRRRALEEIFRRAPQPQVVPVEPSSPKRR